MAGQGDGDVAVLAAVADGRLAEAGPAAGDVGNDPAGDGVPGLLVRCLRHAVHDGRRGCPAVFSPLFTAPSFRTFAALACGFLAQSGRRTVCGMLTGAGLSRLWSHDRAHYFFSRARWDPDDLGIAVARLVIGLLVPGGEPVEVLVDDTLFRRRGKKAWAASWFHDGSAAGPAKTGFGNNWVVLAVRVRLPFMSRPAAVPVMAKLVIKGTTSASRL